MSREDETEVADEEMHRSRKAVDTIDERFAENRLKFSLIINLLLEKEQKRIESGEIDEELFQRLERLSVLDAQNRMKTADLMKKPGLHRKTMTDKAILNKLKETRDAELRDPDNFPAKGPKGPREPIAADDDAD